MPEGDIPSMNDKEWSSKDELGTREEIIEYQTADGKKQVRVTVHLISGEEIEAIEAASSTIDVENEENPVEIDQEKFAMLRLCRIYDISEDTYYDIMRNKPADLRNQMNILANKLAGSNLSKKEIETEKNSDSPVTSPTQ